ncbi:hypothetical protein F5H01DRAFT_71134 [Linnemannia elongata]|nr:hypothetical protein F5H01DRAFT_71134 [Linnemannia elongata]
MQPYIGCEVCSSCLDDNNETSTKESTIGPLAKANNERKYSAYTQGERERETNKQPNSTRQDEKKALFLFHLDQLYHERKPLHLLPTHFPALFFFCHHHSTSFRLPSFHSQYPCLLDLTRLALFSLFLLLGSFLLPSLSIHSSFSLSSQSLPFSLEHSLSYYPRISLDHFQSPSAFNHTLPLRLPQPSNPIDTTHTLSLSLSLSLSLVFSHTYTYTYTHTLLSLSFARFVLISSTYIYITPPSFLSPFHFSLSLVPLSPLGI